jgi:Na+-driven multidrug efflux pump
MLLQAMYGAVDLAVVGWFGDKAGVSAVSTGSLVMATVTGLLTGLTMGATILIAQKIGEKNDADAGKAVGASVLLYAAVGAALTVIMVFTARPLAVLMQAPAEAFEQTRRYILICSSGCVVITAYNAVSAVFRGMGNSKAPLLFVAIACAVNILGDLLLVGAFRLGAAGAAYATVFAQAVSVAFSVWLIRKKAFRFRSAVGISGSTARK